VRVGNIGVSSLDTLADVVGGGVVNPELPKASWIVTTDGGSNLVKSFKVASAAAGAEKTEVGQLVLKLEEPAKPAGK
jgi:hypothetical protein